jgi:FkbM family methyltransferase
MCAIDVGANIGYFTLLMSRAVGDSGRVLAIEAEPKNFQFLRTNLELNAVTNVEALPVAAHHTPGLISIARNPDNHGASTAVLAGAWWETTPCRRCASTMCWIRKCPSMW